ncbi:MAG: hypothetical protein JWN23_737 [Rhodocyclales bacterium]|nr:hypothetical protein [Rhodocyclales bacterium]
MRTGFANVILLGSLLFFCGCASHPHPGVGTSNAGSATTNVPEGSHLFQCHPASPGPCAYVVFNESGSVRETFILAPGKSRVVADIHPRTTFCLTVEKLDPTKCQRLGLDGKPLQRQTGAANY